MKSVALGFAAFVGVMVLLSVIVLAMSMEWSVKNAIVLGVVVMSLACVCEGLFKWRR